MLRVAGAADAAIRAGVKGARTSLTTTAVNTVFLLMTAIVVTVTAGASSSANWD